MAEERAKGSAGYEVPRGPNGMARHRGRMNLVMPGSGSLTQTSRSNGAVAAKDLKEVESEGPGLS